MGRRDQPKPSSWAFAALVVAVIASIVIVCGCVFIASGAYDVAADRPHMNATGWLLEATRERSIARRAAGIVVPNDLRSAIRVRRGAAEYGEMCAVCHLGPGVQPSELSRGLYPKAPELAREEPLPANEEFWVVKHGIKMTAMPSWGTTHDDAILWDIVAFLQRLPSLSVDQYRDLTKHAHDEHDEMKGIMHNMH